MVGVHAAFTCSDETLHAAAGIADDLGVGVHIHVAEGLDDLGAAARTASLSSDDWLVIHGVHLEDDHGVQGTLVHNPRSNMNNSVGYARPTRFSNRVALGTDGIGADMLDEFRLAFVRLRESDVEETPDIPQWTRGISHIRLACHPRKSRWMELWCGSTAHRLASTLLRFEPRLLSKRFVCTLGCDHGIRSGLSCQWRMTG